VTALVLGVIVVLLAATVLLGWAWRALRRELRSVARRLDDETDRAVPVARPMSDALAQALLALDDGVIVVDADGVEIFRNRAAERFRDPRHAEALVAEAMREMLGRARRGERAERELQLFGPPREVLRLRVVPLLHGASAVGAVGFVRDVSELRRVESVRRDFVANVSHELKTPIGALVVLADTMAAGTNPVVAGQLAERVQQEAARLTHIVDDLLDLSLIEAQEAPTREPVPVHVVLREASERVRAAAETVGIPLEFAPVSADLVVNCDRAQLVSAVTNLLDNAVKYSEPGQPVELSGAAGDGFVEISVRDHGIGIPSRDLERIFERFYRVDRARSRATGGTGLGLSIVRHVAQAHGGEVTVESIEGEGSTFRLRLPLASPSAGRLSEAS
jgi:two-component system, OmpR family, sensor histidine kinase SenX3